MLFQKNIHLILSRGEGRIRRIFSIDLRALSFFRIGLALLIIIDLTMGAVDLRTFFTDMGVMPSDLLLSQYYNENLRSIHSISGTYLWQVLLLVINYFIAFCLLIGWKTRRMHILAWIFFCSLTGKNPIINSGADAVMRILLFRAMFLPTHVWRSVDRRNKQKPEQTEFFSWATILFMLQIASIYVRNYVLKTDVQRKETYVATYTALSIDMLRTSVGTLLYKYPDLMRWITWLWVHIEGRGVVLFLIPRKQYRRRIVGCILFISGHLSMYLTMKIGYFPRVCILPWIILLPPTLWSTLTGKSKNKNTNESVTYWNRSKTISFFLILCFLYITMRNLRTTNFNKWDNYFPTTINKFGFLLRLDQYWSMFSPYPLEDDGRFVVSGQQANGNKVNLMVPDKPIFYTKPTPKEFSAMYPSEKRRKLFLNYRSADFAVFRPAYLKRQCNNRNSTHPNSPIQNASMEYVKEQTLPNYAVITGEIIMLATEQCQP